MSVSRVLQVNGWWLNEVQMHSQYAGLFDFNKWNLCYLRPVGD